MNHGLKINNNVLEITLPEEVHIDKVLVNRQMFSQRQKVCESCKYHGLEGHEEPCVSCEVGNSNYVPSVGLEERTEERTETHACDCISRQAAIDALKICDANYDGTNCDKCPLRDERWDGAWEDDETNCYTKLMRDSAKLLALPSAEPKRQKGKWIDHTDEGYVECPFCHSATNCDGNKDELHYCFSCGAKMER